MNLKEFKSLTELLNFLPALINAIKRKPFVFGKPITVEEFVSTVIDMYISNRASVLGAWRGKDLGCFILAEKQDNGTLLIWYVWSNPRHKKYTIKWLLQGKRIGASYGYTNAVWYSPYLNRSYRRLMEKLGSRPIRVMYSLNLNEK